jgi:hypothetical protein
VLFLHVDGQCDSSARDRDSIAANSFTAIGQVAANRIYEYQMSDSFVPFRRNVRYSRCKEVKIVHLLDQPSFTRGNRNWGYTFRAGHFAIGGEDFLIIAEAMLGDVPRMA